MTSVWVTFRTVALSVVMRRSMGDREIRRVAITYDTYMQPAAGSCRYGNEIRQYNERFAKQSLDFLVRALHNAIIDCTPLTDYRVTYF